MLSLVSCSLNKVNRGVSSTYSNKSNQNHRREAILKDVKQVISDLNLFFGKKISLRIDDETWADHDKEEVAFEGSECAYRKSSCVLMAAHEYIHLIVDNHEPSSLHTHISDLDYFKKEFSPSSEQELDDLYSIQHSNTNILAIKTLIAAGRKVTRQDVKDTFEDMFTYIRNLPWKQETKDKILHSNEWSYRRTLLALEEGLSGNTFYSKIGIVSNYALLQVAFEKFPAITEVFQDAKKLSESCIYFPETLSEEDRNRFLETAH